MWLATFPVAALDDERFQWFPLPWWVCVVGYALLLVGMAILTWAEATNKFFEPTVRIQADRNHTVIDTCPYAIVRHPGYVGGVLLFILVGVAAGRFGVVTSDPANEVGGRNVASEALRVQRIHPASPVQAGSWCLVS